MTRGQTLILTFRGQNYMFRCVSTRGTRWRAIFFSSSFRSKIMGKKKHCNFQLFILPVTSRSGRNPKKKISEIYSIFIKTRRDMDIMSQQSTTSIAALFLSPESGVMVQLVLWQGSVARSCLIHRSDHRLAGFRDLLHRSFAAL